MRVQSHIYAHPYREAIMAKGPEQDTFAKHADLKFDVKNPRFASEDGVKGEDKALQYLIQNADVDELVSSIQSSGWIDYEPLIVERRTNVVLEGNRRLAALRLLSDEVLRKKLSYKIPNDGKLPKLPDEVRVRWVTDRDQARAFIAFKHINGPMRWDALAKAKYAAEWINDENADINNIAKQIGDNHNTVLRLVNGWRVLQQALGNSFEMDQITARRFNFSHLYTALSRPNIREFLGLPDNVAELFKEKPIPKGHTKQLEQLMGWIYGQAQVGQQHLIKSQNPDLNRLVKVIGNKRARAVLAENDDLLRAFELVEPASSRFEEALAGAANSAEKALGLVAYYEPSKQPSLQDTIKGLATTVRSIRDSMRKKAEGEDDDL
jgi:hypothetical protein